MPSTGIKKLDEVLMDGLPEGFSVLVIGTPSSGMELFAKQFASGNKNEKAVYFTTSETEDEVKSLLKSYKWREDIDIISVSTQYYEKVLAKEFEASKLKKEGLSVSDIAKLGTFEGREDINFLEMLTYEISKLKKNYRVVIDALDFFLERYPSEDVLSAVRTIDAHVHYTKALVLFTMVKDVYDKRIENSISAIADCVIELEIVKIGTGFENRLIVKKVKNMPQKIVTLVYSITDKGITPETISRIG
ncbi:MAG: RAD55 family ATPase [Candidatus Thermoplasmatota archaeon]|nr:RAD55 family ATPase [Candidatus Thermoplasmatota archaeon]